MDKEDVMEKSLFKPLESLERELSPRSLYPLRKPVVA
jgi:hypothetical protein